MTSTTAEKRSSIGSNPHAPAEAQQLDNIDKTSNELHRDNINASNIDINASSSPPYKVSSNINNSDEPQSIDKQTLLGLIAVYFSVFLDFMGTGIVQPVLPFYANKFNANSVQLGALYSSYSLMTTISCGIMGYVSDRFGRRPSMLLSLCGTMIGFTITGLANNYWTLLTCRFIAGMFGGSMPVAQAYVTDVVPKDRRPKYIAFTGVTMALAFIVGPGIGSGLAEFGIRVPFFVSGLLE